MLWLAFGFALCLLLLIAWYFLFPIRLTEAEVSQTELLPPDIYIYSYAFHIHTEFSYDSLGKPEDVFRARENQELDFVIITDHEVDHMKHFADDRTLVGIERKLNDHEGNLLGDLIEVGELRVIAHHFKEKYRWRLDRDEELLFELIDLKDALLRKKLRLTMHLIAALLLFPLIKKRVITNMSKLIDLSYYADRYLQEGWKNKVIGGLDHHVKLYLREVGVRFLFPSYEHSFSLMRNFLLSGEKIKDKGELPRLIKKYLTLISFSKRPPVVWKEGGKVMVYLPYKNSLVAVRSKDSYREFLGSNHVIFTKGGDIIIEGYTYSVRVWKFLLNVRPAFITWIKVD